MKRFRFVAGACAALLMVGVIAGCAAAPAGGDTFGRIDGWVRAAMGAGHIPGVAVAIVKGQDTVYLKGFGTADDSGAPVTAQTPFVIASTSKSITALAVMQLAEQGKVDLDAPVSQYVPEFRPQALTGAGEITVRQLLNQTSGLSTETGNRLNHADGSMPLDELMALLQGERPVSRPGEAYHYSNANYVLLAALVERASGQPYAQYVREQIFQPLGMVNSAVEPDGGLAGRMATGHRLWFGFPAAMGSYSYAACLNNMSTAEDMAHFLSALLGGGTYHGATICSAEAVQAMEAPAAQAGKGLSYGMGLEVDGSKPYALIRHPGDAPGFSANIALMPAESWGVVVLQNANWLGMEGSVGFIADGICEILQGRDPPPMAAGPGTIRWLFDAIYLVTLFFLALAYVRLGRWRRRLDILEGKKLRKKLIPVVMLNFAMPAGMLLFLPKFFAADWAQGFLNAPDFSIMMLLIAVSLLALGSLRTAFLIQRMAQAKPGAVSGGSQ